jgi:hypothetical protein
MGVCEKKSPSSLEKMTRRGEASKKNDLSTRIEWVMSWLVYGPLLATELSIR